MDPVRACPRGLETGLTSIFLSAVVRGVWEDKTCACPRSFPLFVGFGGKHDVANVSLSYSFYAVQT